MIRLGRCIPHDRTGTMPMSKMCVAVTSHRINKSMNLLLYSVKSFPHCPFGRIFVLSCKPFNSSYKTILVALTLTIAATYTEICPLSLIYTAIIIILQ